MGLQVKGDRWCERCQHTVTGVKGTHRARNTAAVAAMPLTGGGPMFAPRADPYLCVLCGTETLPWRRPLTREEIRQRDEDGERVIRAHSFAGKWAHMTFILVAVAIVLLAVLA